MAARPTMTRAPIPTMASVVPLSLADDEPTRRWRASSLARVRRWGAAVRRRDIRPVRITESDRWSGRGLWDHIARIGQSVTANPTDPPQATGPRGLLGQLIEQVIELGQLYLTAARQEVEEGLNSIKVALILFGVAVAFLAVGIMVLVLLFVSALSAITGLPLWATALIVLFIVLAAGRAVWMARLPPRHAGEPHARADDRSRQGGSRVGATLDETRVELEAQRARVRGTATRLETTARRVAEHPGHRRPSPGADHRPRRGCRLLLPRRAE